MPSIRRFDDPRAAFSALAEPGARLLGGGTLLVRAANMGDCSVTTYVRLAEPGMAPVRFDGGRVRIAASATMAELLAEPALAWLRPAAHTVGGPAVREMATVGGNLFAPSPYGDLATALLALDAEVDIVAEAGVSTMPLETLLLDRDAIRPVLVRGISFGEPSRGSFRFLKAARVHPRGTAILTIASVIAEEGPRFGSPRLAFGAVAPTPVRARLTEAALEGAARTVEGVGPALAACLEDIAPRDDAVSSAWYKRAVLPVHLRRLLLGDEA